MATFSSCEASWLSPEDSYCDYCERATDSLFEHKKDGKDIFLCEKCSCQFEADEEPEQPKAGRDE